MKQILMTAEVSGQPKYSISCACHDVLQRHFRPGQVAEQWVKTFIHCLTASTGFHSNKVRFLLTTHEGAHVHGMVQYFDEECAEDLAKFWIPVVTKYISGN
jgi:hypothetical protein